MNLYHFRSICSSTLGGWYAGLSVVIPSNPNDANEEQKRVNSAVQARIEAMFASVEAESGTPGECAAAILPVMTQIIMHVEHLRERSARHFCSSIVEGFRFGNLAKIKSYVAGTCAPAFSLMLIMLHICKHTCPL